MAGFKNVLFDQRISTREHPGVKNYLEDRFCRFPSDVNHPLIILSRIMDLRVEACVWMVSTPRRSFESIGALLKPSYWL